MSYQTMDVRPIGGALGAEIYGADLKDRDDSPMWQELRQAFLEYHVIAVRGQNMTPADLMRVGSKFGEPAQYPFARGMDGFPLVTRIVKEQNETDAFGNNWHTDTMYLAKPPRATLLYAVETPPKGGDTIFANTEAAYETLSGGMKQLVEGVIGVSNGAMKHRRGGPRAAHFAAIGGMTLQNVDKAEEYEARHPIVRTRGIL